MKNLLPLRSTLHSSFYILNSKFLKLFSFKPAYHLSQVVGRAHGPERLRVDADVKRRGRPDQHVFAFAVYLELKRQAGISYGRHAHVNFEYLVEMRGRFEFHGRAREHGV